ncbi:hypothetical protein B5X24_HaOG216269 [Helicoverpa armigera]|nr:hypothetical protein B5X24_HaOG216269 [Helicoverpa armigera]
MHNRALFATLCLICNVVLCECKQTSNKALTAYFQGSYKGLKIPSFLITPVIIVPKANNENSSNAKLISDEDFFEKGAIYMKITPVKLMFNDTKASEENNDIEVNFRQALNRGSVNKTDGKETLKNETVPKDDNVENTTVASTTEGTTTPNTSTTMNNDMKNTTEISTTEPSGLYPTAVYDDKTVNTLTITDGPPNYFLLPPLLDEEWKNFTVTTNFNITKENKTEMVAFVNTTLSSLVNETGSTMRGPYPPALYHNKEIDQVSITTNSYTNDSPLPPTKDDRWRSFSSSFGEMFPTSNEFRPLAGLYYDGFLHKPLPKKPGFVPYNRYVLY